MTSPDSQPSLFASNTPPFSAGITIDSVHTVPSGGAPVARELSTDVLIHSLLESLSQNRRRERLLLTGATDDELAGLFGNCHVEDKNLIATFNASGEPAVTCRNRAADELFVLSRSELTARLRPITGIGQRGTPAETDLLLKRQLEQERAKARRDAMTRVHHLLGEKLRKRQQGLASCIVPLLFVEDCLTEPVERRTLEAITSLLLTNGHSARTAMQAALTIVEYAAHTWRSVEAFWLDKPFESKYESSRVKESE